MIKPIKPGTTPLITLIIPALGTESSVIVRLVQGDIVIEKTLEGNGTDTYSFGLTQEETLKFSEGTMQLETQMVYEDNNTAKSYIYTLCVSNTLGTTTVGNGNVVGNILNDTLHVQMEDNIVVRLMDLWKPTVDADGNISWELSDSETVPETQNIKGPQGYSPVKGIDYWTQSDIDSIQDDIDSITDKVQADEDIRIANEKKRISDENTRITNEKDRVSNESIRKTNETNRIANEGGRVENETLRISNENARKENEQLRITNETNRKTAESNRVLAENTRIDNEKTRESNETIRKSNESNRVTSENTRISNETGRQTNEETRKTNENVRITNEQGRVLAENSRVQAEIAREQEQEQFFANADNRYLPQDTATGIAPQTEYTIESNAVNYKIYGNSIQETRSGKNILPFPYFFSTITLAGVTFTVNDDGTVILNGKSTSSVEFLCAADFVFSKPGTYSYTLGQTDSNILGYVNQYDSNTNTYIKSMNSGVATFQITENDISDAYYYIISIHVKTANAVFNKVKCSPQLEMSSEPTSYEPYGTMPSPEYPSKVESVGDLVTDGEYAGQYKVPIAVRGKNLLPYPYYETTKTKNGITFTVNDDGTIIVNGTATSNTQFYVSNKSFSIPSGTYTFSTHQYIGSDVMQVRLIVYDTQTKVLYPQTEQGVTVTVEKYSEILIDFTVKSGKTINNMIFKPQIELGTTATAYEPYHEPATITAYLDEPLRKIGYYADYIDWKNQKVIRAIKEKILNGTESYVKNNVYSTTDVYAVQYSTQDMISATPSTLSNRFLRTSPITINTFCSAGLNLIFGVDATLINTINDWKSQLASWNTGDNPLKVYYALATPTEETISLEPMSLQDGTNNILTNTTTQPSNVGVTYYQNPTGVINELRQAIIALQSATE